MSLYWEQHLAEIREQLLMMSGLTDSQFHSGSGPWGSDSLVTAELLYLNLLSSPGPVPGAGFAGLAALALAGLYARTRRA